MHNLLLHTFLIAPVVRLLCRPEKLTKILRLFLPKKMAPTKSLFSKSTGYILAILFLIICSTLETTNVYRDLKFSLMYNQNNNLPLWSTKSAFSDSSSSRKQRRNSTNISEISENGGKFPKIDPESSGTVDTITRDFTLYEILDISPAELSKLSPREVSGRVSSSYRNLARQLHPDRKSDLGKDESHPEAFLTIQVAKDVLNDPICRSLYDRFSDILKPSSLSSLCSKRDGTGHWQNIQSPATKYQSNLKIEGIFFNAILQNIATTIGSLLISFLLTLNTQLRMGRSILMIFVLWTSSVEYLNRFSTLYYIDFSLFGLYFSRSEVINFLRSLFPCVLSGVILLSSAISEENEKHSDKVETVEDSVKTIMIDQMSKLSTFEELITYSPGLKEKFVERTEEAILKNFELVGDGLENTRDKSSSFGLWGVIWLIGRGIFYIHLFRVFYDYIGEFL